MTHITCPHCHGVLGNDPSMQGQVVACPHCGTHFQMPAVARAVPPPLPAQQPQRQTPTTSTVAQTTRAKTSVGRGKPKALVVAVGGGALFVVAAVGMLASLAPTTDPDERHRSSGASDFEVTTSARTLKEIVNEMRRQPSIARSHYTVSEFFGKFGQPYSLAENIRHDFSDSSKSWTWWYVRNTGDRANRGTITLDVVVDENNYVRLEKSKFEVHPDFESKQEEADRLEKTARERAEKIVAAEERSTVGRIPVDSLNDPALAREVNELRAESKEEFLAEHPYDIRQSSADLQTIVAKMKSSRYNKAVFIEQFGKPDHVTPGDRFDRWVYYLPNLRLIVDVVINPEQNVEVLNATTE